MAELQKTDFHFTEKDTKRNLLWSSLLAVWRTFQRNKCVKCRWQLYCCASYFFLQSVRSVVPTKFLDTLNERKVYNVQTRKTQLSLFSLPIESCSVSRNSLRCRGSTLINCLLETGLGTVDFSIRIKRKTLKYMQHVIVKDQISNNFSVILLSCAVTLFVSSLHTLEGPLW